MSRVEDTAEPVDLMPPSKQPRSTRESKAKSILPRPKSLTLAPNVFFKWVSKFNEEQKGRATVALYRDWPVIDKKLADSACKRPRMIALWGDGSPLPFEDPEEWQDFFLKNSEWGGSGKYKCILNEIGLQGAIALTHFKFDDSEYPPVIDPAVVVRGHPDNKGYLDGLRARGIPIPGENVEGGDMNVAQMLNESNQRLLDKMEERSDKLEERLEEIDDSPDVEEQIEKSASEKGFELIAQASIKAMDTHSTATNKAMEVLAEQNKKLAETQAPDPLAYLKIAKDLFGGNGNGGGMEMLGLFLQSQEKHLATVQTMHKDTLEFMQKMEERREKETAVQIAQPQQQNGLMSTLDTMKQIKEAAELFGMSSRRREPIEFPEPLPPSKPWYQAWVENPTMTFAAIAAGATLIQALFNRNGAPAKPVQEVIKDAMEQGRNLMQGAGAGPQQSSQPDPKQQILAFLQFIEPVFITHYFDREGRGLDGFTFAEVFISMTQGPTGLTFVPDGPPTDLGLSQYEAIKGQGLQNFDGLLRGYPPIWNLVQGNLGKYQQFLNQFFTYQDEAKKRTAAN